MRFILFLLLLSSFSIQTQAAEKLKSYKIDPNGITISGISSGAFMALQMAVAYSKTFSGSASIAGGIFWCAQGDSKIAQTDCMNSTNKINPQVHIEYAKKLAEQSQIDPLENFARQKIYVFGSAKDAIIKPPSSDKIIEFSEQFVPKENIKIETTVASAHGFPTLEFGNSCGLGFLPWLLKCNFDTAGEIFKHLYTTLIERSTSVTKNLLEFDQKEFADEKTPLFTNGWVYVPESCSKGEACRLHLALHGCQMNPDFIQAKFVQNAGYNEWAESNHVIVLYPQSAKVEKVNPYACWDWFGFTGANYVTQSGAQMKALKSMVNRLTGEY